VGFPVVFSQWHSGGLCRICRTWLLSRAAVAMGIVPGASFPGCCSPKGRVISCRLGSWCSEYSQYHPSLRRGSAHSLEASVRNSMTLRAPFWLVAAFVISFFAVGFPYWQILSEISLPSTLWYGFGCGRCLAAAAAVGKPVSSRCSCCRCRAARYSRGLLSYRKDHVAQSVAVRVHHCSGDRSTVFFGRGARWKLARIFLST
jgi:hypothetical protein